MVISASFGVAALGWAASPVVKDLVSKSITYLGTDIAEGLEDLETTLLPQLELTIKAVQYSPHAIKVKKWLLRLKNAYYDAEGILHELEYKRLRRKAKGEKSKIWMRVSSHPIIKPLGKFTSKVNKKVSLLSPKKKQLLNRLNKLKKIAAEAKTLRELLTSTVFENGNGITSDNNSPVTSSLLPHRVFGRDGDRDQIIEFLLNKDEKGDSSSSSSSSSTVNESYPVVAISGIGGSGKTTLAQYVYNDPRVTKNFDTRMWVCLSQNLDITKRTKEMIECITKENSSIIYNFNELQKKLVELLSKSKGVLLVLDNFWPDDKAEKDNKQWRDLLAPFACIRGRFKILTTSRTDMFPVSLLPWKHIKLSDLEYADFLALFRYYAGLEINSPQLQNDLYYTIGDSIANKLSKSPLAARVVGDQLYKTRDIGFWQNTERNSNLSDTMDVLLWSYHRMDVQMQRPFLYFGMYPKGTTFSVNMMQIWVALDFIEPGLSDRALQQIGYNFFQMMVGNSIFQMINGMYTMHDLFHDLAEKLSADDCFRVTYAEKEIPSSTLYLYLEGNIENLKDNLPGISNLRNLRTLILSNLVIRDMSNMLSMLSTYFKNLRVLEIRSSNCETLPRNVGNLRNLRYLNVSGSSIKKLPNSICQLYHLQYLLLPESVKILPAKLCNLIKLRWILITNSSGVMVYFLPPVPYLGKLTALQHLPLFHVRKQRGYELTQLGYLREINNFLTILNLENVRDEDEAIGARIFDKPEIYGLQLVWTESADRAISDLEVIEALRPPSHLMFLAIDGYRGSRYPTWLHKDSILLNLKSIGFYNCNELQFIPSNFNQLHHCNKLILDNLGALRELSAFPENLATLEIIECPCLIFANEDELQLQVNENPGIRERRFFVLPSNGANKIFHNEFKSFEQTGSVENCLEQLTIIGSVVEGNYARRSWKIAERAWQRCHQQRMNYIFSGANRANKLKLPPRLRTLKLEYCCISDGALSDCLRDMNFLKELHLEGIMTITSLPPTDVQQTLLSLQLVEIKYCWSLLSLGGLHALPGLLNFHLEGCSRLQVKSDSARLPLTLQSVTICKCIIVENILYGNFTCLQHVAIRYCLAPDSLSFHHLNSLQSLYLESCSSRLIRLCPIIDTLYLALLHNLDVESIVESWPGCQELFIGSSLMLNKLLLLDNFAAPKYLTMVSCQEEVISFEKSVHLHSIKALRFLQCETKNLATSLRDFSNLEIIAFDGCPELFGLPVLPSSVKTIIINDCPVLREQCQPNGPDWHKIQHIESMFIN